MLKILTLTILLFNFCNLFAEERIAQSKFIYLPLENPYFTGRETELQEIKNLLFNKRLKILAITGISGIGKSQLIKKYASKNRDQYAAIWWVNCDQDLSEQLQRLADKINCKIPLGEEKIPEKLELSELYIRISKALDLLPKPWLLILDNANSQASLLPFLRTQGTNGNILITSNNPEIYEHSLKLKGLKKDDAINLLVTISRKPLTEDTGRLATILEYYPLNLVVAGSFICYHPSLDYKNYLELFKQQRKQLWFEEQKNIKKQLTHAMDNYTYNAKTIIKMHLTDIELESPRAKDIIIFCSFLSHQDIPSEFIEIYYKNNYGQVDIEFHKAIKALVEKSVLEETHYMDSRESASTKKSYRLLKTTQQIIQDELKEGDKKLYFNKAIQAFITFCSTPITYLTDFLTSKPVLFDQALYLIKSAEDKKIINSALLDVKVRILYVLLYYKRDYAKALDLKGKILEEIFKADLSKFEAARFLNIEGHLELMKGDLDSAINKTLEALKQLKKIEHPEKPDELCLLLANNLGYYYLFQGNLSRAYDCYQEVQNVMTQIREEHKAGFYFFETQIFLEQGKYLNALESIEKIYAVLEKNPHLNDAFIYADILKAEILLNLNKVKEGQRASQSTYEKVLMLYPNKSSEMYARALMVLAIAQNKIGQHEAALANIKEAITIFDTFYKGHDKNRRQATAHTILGDIYAAQSNYMNASKEYHLAHNIYEKLFKIKEMDDISDLYYKIITTASALNDEENFNNFGRMHIKNFGITHHRSQEILSHAAQRGLKLPW